MYCCTPKVLYNHGGGGGGGSLLNHHHHIEFKLLLIWTKAPWKLNKNCANDQDFLCYKNVYELYEKTCCPDTGSCGYTPLSYCSHTWGWMDLSVSCGSNMGLLPWRRGDRNMTEVRFIQSFISEDSHGVIRWNAQTLDISAAGLNTHWKIWLC